jgi:hypothetical protein
MTVSTSQNWIDSHICISFIFIYQNFLKTYTCSLNCFTNQEELIFVFIIKEEWIDGNFLKCNIEFQPNLDIYRNNNVKDKWKTYEFTKDFYVTANNSL